MLLVVHQFFILRPPVFRLHHWSFHSSLWFCVRFLGRRLLCLHCDGLTVRRGGRRGSGLWRGFIFTLPYFILLFFLFFLHQHSLCYVA